MCNARNKAKFCDFNGNHLKLQVLWYMVLVCSCAPKPPAFDEYFPLEVGNRWEYQEKHTLGISPVPVIWTIRGSENADGQTWYLLDKSGDSPNDEPRVFRVRFDGSRLLWRGAADNMEHVYVDFSKPMGVAYDVKPLTRMARDLREEYKLLPYHAKNVAGGPEFQVNLKAECCDRGPNFDLKLERGIGPISMSEERAFLGNLSSTLIRARIGGKEMTFGEPQMK